MNADTIALHLTMRGRVQGVGFRAFVARRALEHGVEGWVRNCRDGSVEAVIAGDRRAVDRLLAACGQGPPGARVDALQQRAAGDDELAIRRPGEVFSLLPSV
jgi:acylphosphatase